MKKVLVTGFDPFGGERINPAWEAVKRLDGQQIGNYEVIARQIPTVFGESIARLVECVAAISPELVICVGQAGGSADIRIERIAINLNDARIPDNAGKQPIDVPIAEEGPAAYWSTLPVKAIAKQLREQGIPCVVSHSAGTFVCNHLFYGLMHHLAVHAEGSRGGFIHIPFLPEQAAAHPGQPSMGLELIIRALRITIETSLLKQDDIQETAGTIF